MSMEIERKSKCIYNINNSNVDTRSTIPQDTKGAFALTRKNKGNLRRALLIYFGQRNPRLTLGQLNKKVCHLINTNLIRYHTLNDVRTYMTTHGVR